MNLKTYWSSVEFHFHPGAKEYAKYKGGFVYAFVTAEEVRTAIPLILDELKCWSLIPVAVDFVSPYEDFSWDSTEEQEHYANLASQARKSGKVVLDGLHAYENE